MASVTGLLIWGIVTILTFLCMYAVFAFHKRKQYFKKHGIPYLGAGLKTFLGFFTGSSNLVTIEFDLYKAAKTTNAPIVGISDVFGTPSLYIMDLDLVKNIYVKDFEHFVNRRPIGTEKSNQYFKKMLFGMESDQWKGVRAKLSPTFTTGKIRRMFEIFKNSSERMDDYVKEQFVGEGKSMELDFSSIFPKYAMDVIASCAFGIDSKCWDVLLGQRSKFEQMGKQIQFQFSAKVMLKFLVIVLSPKLADILGLEPMDYEAQTYFASVITQIMKQRRQTGERRDDFLQLMMDAQQGLLKDDEETIQVMNGGVEGSLSGTTVNKVTFDDDDIIANGMLFLLAGFDPTQSVLLFSLYNLALEPEAQEKLYREVKSSMDVNGGKLSYEGVLEMNYLDMVVHETMRIFPPTARTERRCTKDYPVPGSSFVIEKGAILSIPIHPYHLDSSHFPNPEKFIPERFNSENKASRHPYAFQPFGHGPRNCILSANYVTENGMRFALVKVKAAIAQLVSSYHFAPCSKTKIPPEFDSSANIKPKGGMWLKVTPRE